MKFYIYKLALNKRGRRKKHTDERTLTTDFILHNLSECEYDFLHLKKEMLTWMVRVEFGIDPYLLTTNKGR